MVIGKCTDIFRGIFSGWVEGGQEKEVMWDDLFMDNLSWGKKNSMKGEQDFLVFLKKKQ